MCGRTVCNLNCSAIQKKLTFINKNGSKCIPKLKEGYNGSQCVQSYNISPRQITPVLYCEKSKSNEELNTRVIQPMYWGLIPSWFNHSLETFKLSTYNAKLESVLEKPTFRSGLIMGYRCAVLIEGFYEWTNGKKKQPYYIKPIDSDSMMVIAGIFDIHKTKVGDFYSYTILTEMSKGKVADIHHRSPVFLHDSGEIEMWLNSNNIIADEAVTYLKERKWKDDDLEVYPVSSLVNNSSNNDSKCILKVEVSLNALCLEKVKETALTKWLSIKTEATLEKKPKLENLT